ncbi:MAG: hypothetical protein KGJ86_20270, partial [Chloroflexota bacterium]|nr:hypothetical protein [Chloroflexota bacterium]
FIFWLLFLLLFCYFGAVLPIWRYAQPVNYIGFWITALTIVFGGLGAFLAFFLKPEVSNFRLAGLIGGNGVLNQLPSGAIQPLWPMLFVTIACGAISGWHALIGSVGTARQIENEADMLPVGGGAMFTEFTLGLLSLLALAVAAPAAAGQPALAPPARFATGIGDFLSLFGIPNTYGTAIGFAAFVVIVITVTQLVFRLMKVTLSEGLGERSPIFRNVHFNTLLSMVLAFLLNITGTFIYIYQLFGASNQLMASLSLIVVTIWLASTKRNPSYTGLPAIFMYITTMAATLVTIYNLFNTIVIKSSNGLAVGGALITIVIAAIIFVAAIMIGVDALRAYRRNTEAPAAAPAPAPAPA